MLTSARRNPLNFGIHFIYRAHQSTAKVLQCFFVPNVKSGIRCWNRIHAVHNRRLHFQKDDSRGRRRCQFRADDTHEIYRNACSVHDIRSREFQTLIRWQHQNLGLICQHRITAHPHHFGNGFHSIEKFFTTQFLIAVGLARGDFRGRDNRPYRSDCLHYCCSPGYHFSHRHA